MKYKKLNPLYIDKEVKRILKNEQPFTKKEMIKYLEENFNKVCISDWMEDTLDFFFIKEKYLFVALWVNDRFISLKFISHDKGKTWHLYEKNRCKNQEFIFS